MPENPEPGIQSVYVCTATMMVTVPPHTCSASKGTVDLSEQYSLPPGEYLVTRRSRASVPSHAPAQTRQLQPGRAGIVVAVDQQ